MSRIGENIQTADFKSEKHVPVIDAPVKVKAGEKFTITAVVGKEIAHPNTTEHFIGSIDLYYKPASGKFVSHLASSEFKAHGESAAGANQGPAYTEPSVAALVSLKESGTLTAVSYCNIHGLWESSVEITVE